MATQSRASQPSQRPKTTGQLAQQEEFQTNPSQETDSVSRKQVPGVCSSPEARCWSHSQMPSSRTVPGGMLQAPSSLREK